MTLLPRLVLLAALAPAAYAQWSSDTMSDAKTLMGVTTAGDLAFFAGGMDLAQLDFARDIVDIYDAGTDTWSTAKLSSPRFYMAAASTDRYVAFAGGGATSFTVDGTIDILDLATGTWSTDRLPIPVTIVSGVGLGSLMFFAGGHTDPQGNFKEVQIFHPESGLWTTKKIKGPKRHLIAALEDGRRAYFVAGMAKPPGTDIVNIFDSLTGKWSWTNMPYVREFPAATVLDGKLYVAGGSLGVDSMDVYDVESEQWSTIRIPTPRYNAAVTSVGPYVILAGGYNGSYLGTADLYSTRTGRWRQYDLRVTALQRSAVTLGDRIVLIAGGQLAGGASTNVVDVLRVGPLGTPYCTPPNANSTGLPALLTAFGSPVASEDLVTLTANHVPPGMPGILLASMDQDFIPFAGGGQGNLCLGGAIARFTADLTIATIDGRLDFDPVLSAVPLGVPYSVQAGETWNFQCWFRDKVGGPTSNFTDAVSVLFQ